MTTVAFEYDLLPAIVRFDAEADDGEEDDDTGSWESELRDSSRPASLKASIMAFAAAMAALAGTVSADATGLLRSGTAETPAGHGIATAEAATRATAAALRDYEAAAAQVIADHAPKIAAQISGWVADMTGVKSPIGTAKVAADLSAQVQQYISGSVVDLRQAANAAVVNWHTAGGTEQALRDAIAQILDGAEWQAKRAVVSEVQTAYKEQFAAAAGRAGIQRVERIAMPNACSFCMDAAGVYPADAADLYDTHPNCCCEWGPADAGASVDFSEAPLVRLEGVLL